MTIKFVVSNRTISAVSLLAVLILSGAAVTPAQERYEGSAGAQVRDIRAAISWKKAFATTPDESNDQQPAANPCWPFSISVNSAPGTSTVFSATSIKARYKQNGDMHVCTFEVSAPVGLPLVIEPSVQAISWLNASELPFPQSLGSLGQSKVRIRFKRGLTPGNRTWTLGAKGVYLPFTFGIVTIAEPRI